ncbi:SusD/RagB family nutrient-binding outer membrane lipoprotein [Flammeovirga sp. EKP202]|uniref:SusD/RagB family nutrient-binding outer membrane lipoprotein n=1 Tax=Flammeovirga sp. EKP202 TaxID=2770592 RepID=UPI00165FC149|nr:SusD/RagB family nutrient-binding outer membrane lipoprotein [Flammeovirga sp. EKP202]MBD0401361.1 SusD/RagB family nutrient-binding outer membrane lipoprotein [Flammeovirga sp. EKP202]
MKKYINYIFSIIVLASMTSCFKNFDEMRENPNSPSEVEPETLFSNVLYTSTGSFYGAQGQYFNLTGAGLWAQHFSKIQYLDEDWYEYRPGVMDEKWKRMYAGMSGSNNDINLAGLYDLELALHSVRKRKAIAEESDDAIGVRNAQALEGAMLVAKAYFFSVTTDVWGDIPYSEAFQTIELGYETTNFQPVYDQQQDIYNSLFELLEEANELLSHGGGIDAGSDIIYSGRTSNWQKLANSLAARLYTRINKVDANTSVAGLTKLFSNPGKYPMFTSNSDDAELVYLGSQPYMQPIYYNRHIDNRDDFAVSKNVVDLLQENNDKRLYIFAQPTPRSLDPEGDIEIEYVGQENGVPREEFPLLNSVSRIGSLYREQPNGKSFWMTYSELKFIEAEAALNGIPGVAGSVQTLVEEGIRASFVKQYADVEAYQAPMIPVAGDEILGAYDDASEVIANLNWNKNGGQFRIIMEQKYLSIFTNGPEAFAELRRTGWPAIDEVRGATQYTEGLPNRFPYPFSEQTSNAANWAKASEGIVNTVYGKKVWFAENTEINYK